MRARPLRRGQGGLPGVRDLTDARFHCWGTGRSQPCESPMTRTSPPRPSGPAAGRSLRSSGPGQVSMSGPAPRYASGRRRALTAGQPREPPHHRGRTFASRTALSRKRLRAEPSTLQENAVPERKVRPRREPQSPTHQRNGLSRSRLIGLCRRRRRPEPLSGRLLHEGGVLLADSRVYSTKVRVSCSTHNPWPVQPHPRAVGTGSLSCFSVAPARTAAWARYRGRPAPQRRRPAR